MIKVIIAEDEKLPRDELIFLLSQENDIQIVAVCNNGVEVLEKVDKLKPDVLFLDIKMPILEGNEVAKILYKRKIFPLIVFSTAYDEYAIEAFEINAVDYLLKPYNQIRLREAIKRIKNLLTLKDEEKSNYGDNLEQKMTIDDGKKFIYLDPNDILFATIQSKKLEIHTSNHVYHSRMTLQQLEQTLTLPVFYRVHRSFLVNLYYVKELSPWVNGAFNLILKNKYQIPVSRNTAKDLMKLLNERNSI